MNRLSSVVVAGALALATVGTVAAPAAARPEPAPPVAGTAGPAATAGTAPAIPARSVTARPGGAAPTASTVTPDRSVAVRPAVARGWQVEVLSVRGTGPYRIGARLDRLVAAGRIDWTAPGCAGVVHAGATGEWAGVVLLAFRHGRLVEVGTATAPPRSPAGAAVGMSFAELERIYGPRGALISNDAGDATAYLVRVGARVELFTGHPIRPGVGYFQVGPASYVERNFRQGTAC
ncbi:hypothetical protein GA0070609_3681 [Micromonospora echinaurantiaca]|uniref:Uncharacterized protein n=1 Tax=Micromonospora echinaurantiaca TaxID=47857 RepID=A0A1C5ISQ1_9ACTN|nr:hypothetical protein [Micromonospora echinaurantiaca]SCG61019.1 hypothetical protein GA0070609_3681 [Micromonospora echinaurantiaca]